MPSHFVGLEISKSHKDKRHVIISRATAYVLRKGGWGWGILVGYDHSYPLKVSDSVRREFMQTLR